MRKLLVKYLWFLAALAILLGYALLFRTAEVDGQSMSPTYSHGDLLLLLRTESLNRGNIVAIYNEQLNKLLCKRVIGVAGDHVVIDKAGLHVNDVLIGEEYVSTPDWYNNSLAIDLVVPDGEVFVMGDNRIASNDSRALGCMACSDTVGVALFNATKLFGVRRETLIKLIIILLFLSGAYELYKKLHGQKEMQ